MVISMHVAILDAYANYDNSEKAIGCHRCWDCTVELRYPIKDVRGEVSGSYLKYR
jgi:hypothetical protein